jgi:hypothetical protein
MAGPSSQVNSNGKLVHARVEARPLAIDRIEVRTFAVGHHAVAVVVDRDHTTEPSACGSLVSSGSRNGLFR